MTDRFAIFQLDDDPELDCIRGASYNDLQRTQIYIDPANYVQMYMSGIRDDDTPINIIRRLREYPPADIPCDGINTSDVLVIVLNDNEIAYYVDGDKLVLLPHFLKSSGDSRIVALDDEDYAIEGKSGTWKVVNEMRINTTSYNIPYYEMKNINDPRQLHILVSLDGKIIAENFPKIDLEVEGVRALQHLENWQKYYENGEYLRTLADYAGPYANYSFIDGSRGNQNKDYTEEIRQTEVGKAEGRNKKIAERQKEEQQRNDNNKEYTDIDEQLSHARQTRDNRINDISDGSSMPGQTVSQGQRPAPTQQDNLNSVLNHLSILESNINARFATIEQRMNTDKETREVKHAVRKKNISHSVEEMILDKEK